MIDKLADCRRRVWPLVVLDLSLVTHVVQWAGREAERGRQPGEVHRGHLPQ